MLLALWPTSGTNEERFSSPQGASPTGAPIGEAPAEVASLTSGPIVASLLEARGPEGRPSRNDAWIELMARVSHELRTPLNAVIGFSDVMDSELLGPVGHPRYREYARHIRDSGRELLKSAEDTLAFTALLADPRSIDRSGSFEVEELAAEAWASIAAAAASRGIRFEIAGAEGLCLAGERRPLRQILTNLLTEAVSRAADGASVVLRASAEGSFAQLELIAEGEPTTEPRPREASLAVCLARALLDLYGASLIELTDKTSAWRAVTVLERAAQTDFFAPSIDDVRAVTRAC
jgi:hypothetical protein